MAGKREAIIQNAEKLVSKGKIEAAIKEYIKIIEENPKDTNILNRIGDLYSRIHRIKDAIKYYRDAAKIWSDDGFYLKAIAMLRKANKQDPSVLEIYSDLGELCLKQGLTAEALTYFQYLGDYYTKNNQFKEAAEIYRKLVQIAPDNIVIRGKLAELLVQTGDNEKAISEFQAIGKMLISKGRILEAIQVYNRALKLDPDNLEMIIELATSLKEEGKTQEIINLLENPINSGTSDPRVYHLAAEAHMQNRDFETAIHIVSMGLRKSPTSAELYELKGEILSRSEKTEDAIVAYHQAADIYLKSKNPQKAISILNKILKRDPQNIPTLQKLVYVNETLKQETHYIQALSMLAEAYAFYKMYPEAIQTLEKLIQLEPENAQHKEKLAFFKQKMGKRVTIEEISKPEVAKEEIEELPEIELPSIEKEKIPEMEEEAILLEEELPKELKDYINEQLVEVDVFFKYNLIDKAIQGLLSILERVPNYIPCLEKLLQVYLEDGKIEEASKIGKKLMELYEKRNQREKLENLKEQLLIQGVPLGEEIEAAVAEEVQEAVIPSDTLVNVSIETEKIEEIPKVEEEFEIEFEEEVSEIKGEIKEEPKIEFEEIEELEIKPEFEEIKPPEKIEEIIAEKREEKVAKPKPDISLDELIGIKEKPKQKKELKLELPDLKELEDLSKKEKPAKEAKKPEVFQLKDLDKIIEKKEIKKPPEIKEVPKKKEAEKLFSELDSLIKKEKPKKPTVEIKPKPSEEKKPQALGDFLSLEEEIGEILIEKKAPANEPPVELLGELDFYMEQEIMDEAEKIINDLKNRFPDHPETLSRIKKFNAIMENLKKKPIPQPEISDGESLFSEEEEFFDLAAELEEELKEEKKEVLIPSQREPTLEEVFEQFKAGVQQTLSPEDYDTHYNLGIAYKEMGLIDEAISEFQIACKDPSKLIDCCSMLGLCFQEKGMPQLAEKWYKKALDFPEITEEAQLGILYDLANLYLQTGDIEKAHSTFLKIYEKNSDYRDVKERLKEIEKTQKGVH